MVLLRMISLVVACMLSAGDVWICKPTGLNQGRGIFLIRDLAEFRSTYLEQEFPDIGRRPKYPADKIVQR